MTLLKNLKQLYFQINHYFIQQSISFLFIYCEKLINIINQTT